MDSALFFLQLYKSGFLTNSVVLTHRQSFYYILQYYMYAAKFTEQAENYTRLVDPSAL
jgi:hypothetical protein